MLQASSGTSTREPRGASVFFKLGDLRPGNKVMVSRQDGLVAVSEFTGVRRYPKDHFPHAARVRQHEQR